MLDTPWTDEKINQLRELWDDPHLTTRQMGAELGVSKSSVIGKAFRLNLPRKPIKEKKKKAAPRPRKRPPTRRKPPLLIPAVIAPIEGGLSILELQNAHCRAIIGQADGETRYCGATKRYRYDQWGQHKTSLGGELLFHGAFCPGHAALYYLPPKT